MLRRRIFSSAMASVMALSSIAVVANAEETVNQYKTADDLKELVEKKYGADWRADELPAYGTVATEAITDALEAAEQILDRGGDSKDYTYAYFMVESVVAEYEIKTNEDLKKLVADCKPTYTKGNVYNEELNDLIYYEDPWATFEGAFEDAEATIDSEFATDITDAWYALNKAYNGLKKYGTVTKQMFRNALVNYEQILQNALDYDYWRMGTLADVSGSLKTAYDKDNKWKIGFGATVPYGSVIDRMLIIQETVKEYYNKLDNIKGLTETSDKQYVKAYESLLDAYTIYKAWTPDNAAKGTKASVKKLLQQYNGQFIFEDADLNEAAVAVLEKVATTTTVDDLFVMKSGEKVQLTEDMLEATDVEESAWDIEMGIAPFDTWANNGAGYARIKNVSLTIVPKKTMYIPIKDGYIDMAGTVYVQDKAPEGYSSTTFKRIGAGVKFDLTELVKVDYAALELTNPLGLNYDANGIGTFKNWETWNAIFTDSYLDVSLGLVTDDIALAQTSVYKNLEGNNAVVWGANPDNWNCMNYNVDLATALELASTYLNFDSNKGDKGGDIFDIFDKVDSSNVVSPNATEIKYNGNEWTTVYRYLNYALYQRYESNAIAAAATYDRRDVAKLIEDCNKLADKIGDTQIFSVSHGEMVDARQEAREWLRVANSDKYYKKDSAYDGLTATDVYNALNGKYTQVVKEEAALSVTFGEIYDKLAQTAADIDADKLTNSASLQKAMLAVANALYKIDPVTDTTTNPYYDNEAFDEDLNLIAINRVITNNGDPVEIRTLTAENGDAKTSINAQAWGMNPEHVTLMAAYNALKMAIAEQAAPATAKGDVDNDGTAYTVKDALAALKIANKLQDLTVDIEVADHNDNDTVDVSDALAILKKANGLA